MSTVDGLAALRAAEVEGREGAAFLHALVVCLCLASKSPAEDKTLNPCPPFAFPFPSLSEAHRQLAERCSTHGAQGQKSQESERHRRCLEPFGIKPEPRLSGSEARDWNKRFLAAKENNRKNELEPRRGIRSPSQRAPLKTLCEQLAVHLARFQEGVHS